MSTLNQQPYELSAWSEVIVPKYTLPSGTVVEEHFDEVKIAVIGSNTMKTELRAYNVALKESVNGEKTLTFELLRKYVNESGELVDNPFLDFLSNERKVKLRIGEAYTFSDDLHELSEEDVDEKWIDFVIKNKDEDSESFKNSYTAKEIFINELGKNGYAVTLDTELENNYGTIKELSEKILEDSGWTVNQNSYSPTESITRPLFKATLAANLSAVKALTGAAATIPSGAVVYPLYDSLEWDSVANKWKFKSGEVQFLYKGAGLVFSTNDTDDKRVVIDPEFAYNYTTTSAPSGLTIAMTGLNGEDALQGNAIVKNISTHFNATSDEYVKDYTVTNAAAGVAVGTKVLGTTETQYLTSSIVQNHLTNSKNFVSNLAWLPQTSTNPVPAAASIPYPVLTRDIAVTIVDSKLRFTLPNADTTGRITHNGKKVTYYYKATDYTLSGANYTFSIPLTAFGSPAISAGTYSLTYSLNKTEWPAIQSTNYLAIPMSVQNSPVYNEGPSNIRLGLVKDKIYVVRTRARMIKAGATDYGVNGANISTLSQPTIKVELGSYDGTTFVSKTTQGTISLTNGQINSGADTTTRGYGAILAGNDTRAERIRATSPRSGAVYVDEAGYAYTYIQANESTLASVSQIHLRIINTTTNSTHNFYVEDIQVFDYIEDSSNVPIFLGDIPTAQINFINRYFYLNSEDEKVYLAQNDAYYAPVYKANYEAVRHVDIKESNYFNNINELAEVFEVWVRFKIYHQKNGKILFDEAGMPRKEIIFSRYAPNGDVINYAGFKYGINLKGIQRNLVSTGLATKVIVKNNNQEFAVDGMCSITRATDNPTSENEIYNFNYYVNQGLISYTQLLADLYGTTSSDLALYPRLKAINQVLSTNLSLIEKYNEEIDIATAYRDMAQEGIDSADEELAIQKSVRDTAGTDTATKEKAQAAITQLEAQRAAFVVSRDAYDATINNYTTNKTNTMNDIVTPKLAEKKALKKKFYQKYSRFIQEGTWADDSYVDDNLYYLDAVKVAAISAYPTVSYQINVVDVSGLEGYEAFKFRIGDKTYVEDTEFFGWVNENPDGAGNVLTPFKMDVIVSEVSRNFDDLSKSTLTIKNYKNQFEELFQKMAATTAQLQYESGGYGRAAEAIKPNGEIEVSTLEKAMANNAFTIANSKNQSVIWDSGRGIEVTDTNNSSLKLRIVAGGIFMTTDGGKTWTSGVTGAGINTNYLLAGQIDASKINIISNGSPIFRWDVEGISAFYNDGTETDATRFVRFNQYGLYGTGNGFELAHALAAAATYEDKIKAIQDNSNFSLTWEGLFLTAQDGAVSLNATNGFEVFGTSTFSQSTIEFYDRTTDPSGNSYEVGDPIPVVSLGKYFAFNGDAVAKYGLIMRNSLGEVSLSTDDLGNLWVSNLLSVGGLDPYQLTTSKTQDTVITRDTQLHFTIFDTEMPTEGTIIVKDSESNFNYIAVRDYTYANGAYTFAIPAAALDSSNLTIVSGNSYQIIYPIKAGIAYRYLGIDGRIASQGTDPVILYAGDYSARQAPFQVSSSGVLTATNAKITGTVNATDGHFTGGIRVGDYSGISGVMNDPTNPYAIWAGLATNLAQTTDVIYIPAADGNPATVVFYLTGYPTDLLYRGVIDNLDAPASAPFSLDSFIVIGSIYEFTMLAEPLGITESGSYRLVFSSREPNFYVTPNGKVFAHNVEIVGTGTFTGTVNAVSGNFTGEINATSGHIYGQLYFGTGTDSYIGYTEQGGSIINISNGQFEVDSLGNTFANNLYLSYNPNWGSVQDRDKKNKYNIFIGNESGEGYIFKAYDQNTSADLPQEKIVFGINRNGNVFIDGTLVSNELLISGLLKAGDILIDGLSGGIYNKTPAIDGWGIYSDGSAVFSNVSVRGKIQSAVFEHNTTSSVGGNLLVSPSIVLNANVGISDGKFDISGQFLGNSQVWSRVDRILINAIIDGVRKTYSAVEVLNGVIEPSEEMDDDEVTVLPSGTQIVSISYQTNSILLSAEEADGPTISMVSYTAEGNRANVVVIGNLASSRVPTDIFHGLSGHGLYADNAYLTGQLYLPNAGVTNEETEYDTKTVFNIDPPETGAEIRFWAGAEPANKSTAPFAVTQDGRLYATDGYFKGQITATNSVFSGELITAGILIDENDLTTAPKHFYVSYPYTTAPSPDSYIIDINRDGLNIWDGGFQIYSDYYSGWRGEVKSESVNAYYGYQAVMNEKPYPIFGIRDYSEAADFVPRISQIHSHVWKREDGIAYSTRVSPSVIDFGKYSITDQTSDYDDVEGLIYDLSTRGLTVGLLDTAQNKYGVQTNSNTTIYFGSKDIDTFKITPKYTPDGEGGKINTSVSQIEGVFKFGELVQVTQDSDGLVFTYLGAD